MRKLIYPILILMLISISCEDKDVTIDGTDEKESSTNSISFSVSVFNIEEWTVGNSNPRCSGAMVKLKSANNT